MHFFNSNSTFMFRHCHQRSTKKFDLNREKKNQKSNSPLMKILS